MARRSRFHGYCLGCDERVTTTFPDRDHVEIVGPAHHDDGHEVVVRERDEEVSPDE